MPPQSVNELEQEARAFGDDPAKVEQRLRAAVPLLRPTYRVHFQECTFDALTRSLYSYSMQYALVWLLRFRPDQPVGYLNQQNSAGIVELKVLGAWDARPNA